MEDQQLMYQQEPIQSMEPEHHVRNSSHIPRGLLPSTRQSQRASRHAKRTGQGTGVDFFAAKPQVVADNFGSRQGKRYRDPYREYLKVAPQNLMYDRRVVRGNTFAALVVPVNMQPEPIEIERFRLEETYKHQKQLQRRRQKREEFALAQSMEQTQALEAIQMYQSTSCWEELSDKHNMVHEDSVEPDYFIDIAPNADLIPASAGDAKETQIWEGDQDLFDYEQEVEPILQVLVGKSIEHARIEIIEEHEAESLAKHKEKFLQLKEAELMQVQRLENGRLRKNDEIDMRSLQQRTGKNDRIGAEKKIMSKIFAKDFLMNFKRDEMKVLFEQGFLKKPLRNSMGLIYVPLLKKQVCTDLQNDNNVQASISNILNNSIQRLSYNHKAGRQAYKNKMMEQIRDKQSTAMREEQDKQDRKNNRQAMRERKRVGLLYEQITYEMLHYRKQMEYTAAMPVYDIKDLAATDDGVIVMGGMIGQVIITLQCLQDYVRTTPMNHTFTFDYQNTLKFMLGVFCSFDSPAYQEGVFKININKKKETMADIFSFGSEQVSQNIRNPKALADIGLKFMLEDNIRNELLNLDEKLVDNMFQVLAEALTHSTEKWNHKMNQIEGDDAEDEEAKNAYLDKVDKARSDGQKMQKLQSLIRIQVVPDPEAFEQCLIKLNNYRMDYGSQHLTSQVLTSLNTNNSKEELGTLSNAEEEGFDPESIPHKIPLVKPFNLDTGLNNIAYHAEAPFFIRKILLERAIQHFPELTNLNINKVLVLSNVRTQAMHDQFEEMLIQKRNFGRGCMYQDINAKLLYMTFLQE